MVEASGLPGICRSNTGVAETDEPCTNRMVPFRASSVRLRHIKRRTSPASVFFVVQCSLPLIDCRTCARAAGAIRLASAALEPPRRKLRRLVMTGIGYSAGASDMRNGLLTLTAALLAPFAAFAQSASPHAIDIPGWFSESLLDLREDVREAAKEGKRLLLYFGQDGCPYCKALMQTNFTQPLIVSKTRRHFVAIALNIWGDREVTMLDGKVIREKEFARLMRVQFTPTILFLDEKGGTVARLNGYYPPHRFEATLDYVAGRMEGKQSFADYMSTAVKEAANEKLHEEPFFMRPPYDLRRRSGSKPLAVAFETPYCAGCDELHAHGFTRAVVKADLGQLHGGRFALRAEPLPPTRQGLS